MENKEKFDSLMSDENFIIKILELQTPDEVKAEFEKNGVKLTEEELKNLESELQTIIDAIDEDDLSNISGGNKSWQDVSDKAWDKFGEGLGNAMWLVPTVVISAIVKWWIDRRLKKREQRELELQKNAEKK